MKQIDVPGQGTMTFPDSMADEDIVQSIQSKLTRTSNPSGVQGLPGIHAPGLPQQSDEEVAKGKSATFLRSFGDEVGNLATGIPKGAYNLVRHPVDTFTNDAAARQLESGKKFAQPVTPEAEAMNAFRSVTSHVPLLGPMAGHLADTAMEDGDEAAGAGLADIGATVAPEMVGPAAGLAMRGAGAALRGGARVAGAALDVNPDLAGLVSPRLAHGIRMGRQIRSALSKGKVAEAAPVADPNVPFSDVNISPEAERAAAAQNSSAPQAGQTDPFAHVPDPDQPASPSAPRVPIWQRAQDVQGEQAAPYQQEANSAESQAGTGGDPQATGEPPANANAGTGVARLSKEHLATRRAAIESRQATSAAREARSMRTPLWQNATQDAQGNLTPAGQFGEFIDEWRGKIDAAAQPPAQAQAVGADVARPQLPSGRSVPTRRQIAARSRLRKAGSAVASSADDAAVGARGVKKLKKSQPQEEE